MILDVDTGVDDALAILYAVASPEIELLAVTCVNGNVPVDMVVRNTLVLLEAAGRTGVEVAAGAERPLVEPERHGYEVHGPEGLGHARIPVPTLRPSRRGAVELLVEELRAAPGRIALVTTGPLTNLALALRAEPGLLTLARSCTMMAGAFRGRGNTLPRSEANVWYDPEAADEVFRAAGALPEDALPLAIGLDVTEEALLRPRDLDRICEPAPDSALARLIRDASEFYIGFERATFRGLDACFLHDPLAVAAAIDPSLVATEVCHVEVELEGRHTRGETVADFVRLWRHPLNEMYGLAEAADNLRAATEVDERTFEDRFVDRLRELVAANA
jgi:purine nucleosidase